MKRVRSSLEALVILKYEELVEKNKPTNDSEGQSSESQEKNQEDSGVVSDVGNPERTREIRIGKVTGLGS